MSTWEKHSEFWQERAEKAERTATTWEQQEFIDWLNANGAVGMIVHSLDEIIGLFSK